MESIPDEDKWYDPGTKLTLHFNEEGMFVTDQNEKFPKGFKNDNNFSDWLHKYVERRMAEKGLITSNYPDVEGGSPIWYTPNALHNARKLLLLICGSGRIHAGLFSVGVCAYHGLAKGSCLSWIDYAKAHDMEVLILNPNHFGYQKITTKFGGYGCTNHCLGVIHDLVMPNNIGNVYIVAHSMGGSSACALANTFQDWFIKHVQAVALTDACESPVHNKIPYDIVSYLKTHCIDWTCSKEEINKELKPSFLCPHRSAGTTDHPLSTGQAMSYILEFFKQNGSEE